MTDDPEDTFEVLAEHAELARRIADAAADRLTLPQTGMILQHLCDGLDAQLTVIVQAAERVEGWARTARGDREVWEPLAGAHLQIEMSRRATEAGLFLLGKARGALLDIERERKDKPAMDGEG